MDFFVETLLRIEGRISKMAAKKQLTSESLNEEASKLKMALEEFLSSLISAYERYEQYWDPTNKTLPWRQSISGNANRGKIDNEILNVISQIDETINPIRTIWIPKIEKFCKKSSSVNDNFIVEDDAKTTLFHTIAADSKEFKNAFNKVIKVVDSCKDPKIHKLIDSLTMKDTLVKNRNILSKTMTKLYSLLS